MAKVDRKDRVDPHYHPETANGEHPVTEITAASQGALSPFGDITFPVDPETLGYHHPDTEINK